MRPVIRGLLVAVAFSATLGALPASAQQTDQAKFLADAIRGNLAEVKLGQLAAERGQSQAVREYGDMLRKDHTKSLEKASSLANEVGAPASSELSAQQEKQFDALQKLSGDEFDTTFLSQMVGDHQANIAKFSAQAKNGSDPQVMAYAKETLPALQMHLQRGQSIQSDLAAASKSAAHAGTRYGDSSPSAGPSRGSGTNDER